MEKGGRLGLNEPQRLPLTKAKPFRFESDNRLELRKKKDNEDDLIEKNNDKSRQERSCDGVSQDFSSHVLSFLHYQWPMDFAIEKVVLQDAIQFGKNGINV